MATKHEDAATFKISYDQAHGWLTGSITGTINSETLPVYAKAVADRVSKHDCKRFLNDLRQAQLDLSTIEIYEIPGVLEVAGIDKTWRRAIVASRDLEDYRFFQAIAFNRGYTVRVFTELDAAKHWLGEKRG
jgi:hypothetical protein